MIKLGEISTAVAGDINILGHNFYSIGMDGAQVSFFKKTYEVGLHSLLKIKYGRFLEVKVAL